MKEMKSGKRKGKKQKGVLVLSGVVLAATLIGILGINNDLAVRNYQIKSKKINHNIRVVLITDLHSCNYGEGQADLLDCIEQQHPDLILFGGDIVDDRLPVENAYTVIKILSDNYPCFYVSGNHEFWTGRLYRIKQEITSFGTTVLDGQRKSIVIKEQAIDICGIDDAEIGETEYDKQLERTGETTEASRFTILLAHRPEYISAYLEYEYDLILSGHAHGGQWRVPGLLNGFLSPNQGFFPEFAGGEYQYGDKTFIVSRGLARESTRIPRIYNQPELVVIDIVAE